MIQRVLILFNPTAGQASDILPQLEQAASLWRQAGWSVVLSPTRCAGDATHQAREAAEAGWDLVAAAGGDGTVNEVINGIVGSQTALAVLPCGTVNIWAREMGLSMDIAKAAKAFLQAQRRQLDLGVCRSQPLKLSKQNPGAESDPPERSLERYFLLMASAGFDAAVTAEVDSTQKKRLGAIAYIKQAFQTAYRYRGIKTKLYIDGKRVRGRILMVIIGNSQLYGGVIKFTAHALVDDGLLDVCVIKGRNLWIAPQRLLSVFTRFYNKDNQVRYYRAQRIEIRGKKRKKRLPVQLDGDYLALTPMTFEVVPGALYALVPEECDPSLWSQQRADAAIAKPQPPRLASLDRASLEGGV